MHKQELLELFLLILIWDVKSIVIYWLGIENGHSILQPQIRNGQIQDLQSTMQHK